MDPITVTEGDTIIRPEDPIKTGFIFIEWQLEGKLFDFSTPITKDITLKAIWVDENTEFAIAFDTDGGNHMDTVYAKAKEGFNWSINNNIPIKEGFTFIEWQLDEKPYKSGTPIFSNITLKAIWGINKIVGDWEIAEITDEILIKKYRGSATEIEIPSTLDNKDVVGIGGYLFGQDYNTPDTTITSVDMSKATKLKIVLLLEMRHFIDVLL